ncbi:MAG: hypothetical protein GF408_02995 [Candidatus Omnitrophica bacterium]|nr:hypothetical protein [Candidatus Omnitrophota bacterium]
MKKVYRTSTIIVLISFIRIACLADISGAQSAISDQRSFSADQFSLPGSPVTGKEEWKQFERNAKQEAPERIPFLRGEEQYISKVSPLAVTVIAAHIERMPPRNLPRQTKEDFDPVDFVHLKNIGERTINLSEYYISDAGGRKACIRRCAGGKDVFLEQGQEIRIAFSGDTMRTGYRKSLEGKIIIVSEGLSKKGETVTVYDPSGRPIVSARSAYQHQDDITIFNELNRGNIVFSDMEMTKADPGQLDRVSHYIEDFR